MNNNGAKQLQLTPQQMEALQRMQKQQQRQKAQGQGRGQGQGQSQGQGQANKPLSADDLKRQQNNFMHMPPHMVTCPILIPQLVEKLWPVIQTKMDVKYRYKRPEEFVLRLRQVFFSNNYRVFWITVPLLHALLNFDKSSSRQLEKVVQPPVGSNDQIKGRAPPGFTFLAWSCQWMSLERQVGWQGKDDIVALLIALGADVNSESNVNGENPNHSIVFHAAKFGTVETLRLLADAGADFCRREKKTRSSVLKLMLDRPDPEKISFVLDRIPNSCLNESYDVMDSKGGRRFRVSAVDNVINSWFSDTSIYTWKLFGEPSAESCILSMQELLRRGCKFSQDSISMHFLSQLVSAIDNPAKFDMKKVNGVHTAKALIGTFLPDTVRQKFILAYKSNNIRSKDCEICSEKGSEAKGKLVTLSCGHTFQISCILEYAKSSSRCPICKRDLCRELISRQEVNSKNPAIAFSGPETLTVSQTKAECEAINIEWNESAGSALLKRRVPSKEEGLYIELSMFQAEGRHNNGKKQWITPKNGQTWVPIKLKDVHIFASLSTSSTVTLVSPNFVNSFALQKSRLSSDKLPSGIFANRTKCMFTVVDEFEIMVGDVSVKLNNAVMCDPSPGYLGIQLGQDFFKCAAFSQLNVVCASEVSTHDGMPPKKEFMATTEGGYRVGHTLDSNAVEELRYYGKCGNWARVPIYHLPFLSDYPPCGLVLKPQEAWECHWCGRYFPGMMRCPPCAKIGKQVNYCDERCQKKAWKIHKLKPPHTKA